MVYKCRVRTWWKCCEIYSIFKFVQNLGLIKKKSVILWDCRWTNSYAIFILHFVSVSGFSSSEKNFIEFYGIYEVYLKNINNSDIFKFTRPREPMAIFFLQNLLSHFSSSEKSLIEFYGIYDVYLININNNDKIILKFTRPDNLMATFFYKSYFSAIIVN